MKPCKEVSSVLKCSSVPSVQPRFQYFIYALAVVFLFLAGCSKEEAPQLEDPFRAYMHKNRMDGMLFSSSEDRVLYATPKETIANVYSFDINLGMPTQITNSKTGAIPIGFFGEDQVMYTEQPEGQTVDHIYLKQRDGGILDLTPWPGIQSVFYQWGGKRKTFYFGSNKEDRRFLYVYRIDPNERVPSTVLQTQDMRFVVASPDGRFLALWKYSSPSQSDMYLYDMEKKLLEKVAPETGSPVAVPQFFDSSNRLYYLSNATGSISLAQFEMETHKHEKINVSSGGSMVFARQNPAAKLLVIGFLKDGTLHSSVFRLEKDSYVPVLTDQPGASLDISLSEKWLLHDTRPDDAAKGLRLVNLETQKSRDIQAP